MKWLLAPFLWAGAAVIAAFVVYRLWRGKPLILRGKFGPRVLRMVAILLVLLGLGADEKPAQAQRNPVPAGGNPPVGGRTPNVPVPAALAENLETNQLQAWLAQQRAFPEVQLGLNPWTHLKGLVTRLKAAPNGPQAEALKAHLDTTLKQMPPAFAALIRADLDATRAGKELPAQKAATLLEIARTMEAQGIFDPWLTSYLWRFTAPLDATRDAQAVEVLTALTRQVRITHALMKAHSQVKPDDAGPRAWMSKAGLPRGFGRFGFDEAGVAQFAGVFNFELAKADLGPWQQDGIARFKLPESGPLPTLLRTGSKVAMKAGEMLRFNRLDALEVPAGVDVMLEHEVFGKVRLPAGQTLLVWDLARLLDDTNRPLVSRVVRAALDGKVDAARQVEQALPLCQRLLREELRRDPEAPGAARMRLILALFDDAVTVPPASKPGAP